MSCVSCFSCRPESEGHILEIAVSVDASGETHVAFPQCLNTVIDKSSGYLRV